MADAIKECSIQLCTRPSKARGWCNSHYKRWSLYGDPLGKPKKQTVAERFWDHVDQFSDPNGCWNWLGNVNTTGYGRFGVGKKIHLAHRFSYQLANHSEPGSMQVDHVCHNRRCVKPAHLRLVTNKQNTENRQYSKSRGVSKTKTGRWAVMVTHNYRVHYVGTFDDYEDAVEAARLKRCELFTHNDADRAS